MFYQYIFVILFIQSILCDEDSDDFLKYLDGYAYLGEQYRNAAAAYGPGLGVFGPNYYVDISYNNLPFVGKIPSLGKEGTSSRLGVSPFYPEKGNPSNPMPPIYRAKPIPAHISEPVELVAVPLDEEALHGFPLFPPELVLPGEMEMAGEEEEELVPNEGDGDGDYGDDDTVPWPSNPPKEPFGDIDDDTVELVSNKNNLVSTEEQDNLDGLIPIKNVADGGLIPIEDEVLAKNMDVVHTSGGSSNNNNNKKSIELLPKNPFNRRFALIRRQLS